MTLPSADVLRAACDRLATPRRAKRPLRALVRAPKKVEPSIKVSMPKTTGLAKDPLDRVAYANPLGYLPEVRGLIDEGADEYGLLRWTGAMETIAVYAAARVLAEAVPERSAQKVARFKVDDEDARVVWGDLTVTGDLQNGGVLVVIGSLTVNGTISDRSEACHVVVLGSLKTRFASLDGGVAVRGDLVASAGMVSIGHENTVYVGGVMRSPLVVLYDRTLRAAKRACTITIDSRAPARADVKKAKRKLVPALFNLPSDDEDDDDPFLVDMEAMIKRGRAKQPLLRR